MLRTLSSAISERAKMSFVAAFLLTTLWLLAFTFAVAPSKELFASGQASTQNLNASAKTTPRKRIAAPRSSETPEGSRVTIAASGALNDYSAYRSGDRFFVVIPEADAPQALRNMRGRGFASAQVQKRGSDAVISFQLQPGTVARVDQKFNKLDIIFSLPGATSAGNTNQPSPATEATPKPFSSPRVNQAAQSTSSPAISNRANQQSAAQPLPANLAAQPQPPLESSLTANAPQPTAGLAAGADKASSTSSATSSTSSSSLGATIAHNWWLALVAALVLVGAGIAYAARARGNRASALAERAAGQEYLAELHKEKQIAPAVAQFDKAPREVKPSAPVIDVERINVETQKVLAGEPYDETIIGAKDSGTRQFIAAGLLSALAGRNAQRRDNARAAFIKHDYFDDATRDLRIAEAPAERASAARSLGLARDAAATPHLIAALEDDSPEVRRAVVEALAEVSDPQAVSPLEALREREKDRKIPRALIQRAIEASVVGLTKPQATPDDAATPDHLKETSAQIPAGEEASPESTPETESVASTETIAKEKITAQREGVAIYAATHAEEEDAPELFESSFADEAITETQFAPPLSPQQDISDPASATRWASSAIETADSTSANSSSADAATQGWVEVDMSEPEVIRHATPVDESSFETSAETTAADAATRPEEIVAPSNEENAAAETVAPDAPIKEFNVVESDKRIAPYGDNFQGLSNAIEQRFANEEPRARAAAIEELARVRGESCFGEIGLAFDDPASEVRDAAARALFNLSHDRAATFTRMLREAPPERRRKIGAALASSGLASEVIGHLMGESRDNTYDAFSLLFLMSKAGETAPLLKAIEEHPNTEVRLAVVKLLALSGQQEILPAFRRLAVRGSLPPEVRSAVMEAIYQISNQSSTDTPSAA